MGVDVDDRELEEGMEEVEDAEETFGRAWKTVRG
jgi:hypothetical protein